MGEMPISFQNTGSPAIASYDYVDIAAGTGIITFYAADVSGSGILVTNSIYSRLGYTQVNTTPTTKTFDATFNRAITLKGSSYVNIPLAVNNHTGTPQGPVALVVGAQLSKINADSSETFLVSGSDTWDTGTVADTAQAFGMASFKLTLPNTHFSTGESLRYKLFLGGTASATFYHYAAHDPKGRIDVDDDAFNWRWTTQTILGIPTVIDI